MRESLYRKLKAYAESDYYGFHMPGHKRNRALMGEAGEAFPWDRDITEIEGFDDLHHPEGILREMQERAARLFGAGESLLSVGGSTAGILAALLGAFPRSSKVLVGRYCHRSVFHALELGGLEPVFLYPPRRAQGGIAGAITQEQVEEALRANPEVRGVILVSPTYEGVCSPVAALAQTAHRHGVPLIVDQAHGAHFGFHPYFPENANRQGADVVIQSLHKTLPSPTQTALLHLNGEGPWREEVRRTLGMVQSSSPSYVLLAGMDACLELLEDRGAAVFEAYARRLQNLRQRLGGLAHLRLLEGEDLDPSKLVIRTENSNKTAKEIYQILLERYHLQMEMVADTYVVAMTGPGDTSEGFARLEEALFALDDSLALEGRMPDQKQVRADVEIPPLQRVLSPSQARRLRQEGALRRLSPEACIGLAAAEPVYLYPPGIPLVLPGEQVSARLAGQVARYSREGFSLQGLDGEGKMAVFA